MGIFSSAIDLVNHVLQPVGGCDARERIVFPEYANAGIPNHTPRDPVMQLWEYIHG